ncbi:MAG: hypothetical protein RIC57_08335 [Balneola sp.]
MKTYIPLIISIMHLVGNSDVQKPTNSDVYSCDSISVLEGATRAASGLTHGYALEAEWLKNSLSTEEADKLLWDFWIESWNEKKKEILKKDTTFQRFALQGWENLKNKKEPSDEFWYYTTPIEYWNALAGQEGIVLLRKCKVVGTIITWQS